MSIKVSVVVPVYNPGRFIEPCIDSLLRQTMPAGEFEVLFVDDGSTDGTPARLDALCAEHRHFRVIHQPNSGWPGKPRNEGIKAARGEYVYFVDNDDWIGDEALERLYGWATRQDADLVIGKMIGINRGVPRVLFRTSHPTASLRTTPLIDSLTPHKLVRRSLLLDHDIFFPEGRRRLEDHVFVVRCYFAARRIAVASDYDYYFHISRPDAGNAGFRRIDWAGYFVNLREALDVVVASTGDSTDDVVLRERLWARWLRVEILGRLTGGQVLRRDPGETAELFTAARTVVEEYFGPGVDALLDPAQRLAAAVLRAGTADDMVVLARFLRGAGWRFVLEGVRPAGDDDDGLDVLVRAVPQADAGIDLTGSRLCFTATGTVVEAASTVPTLLPSARLERLAGRRSEHVDVSWDGPGLLRVRLRPRPGLTDAVWRLLVGVGAASGTPGTGGPVETRPGRPADGRPDLPFTVGWAGAAAVAYSVEEALCLDVGPTQLRHIPPALPTAFRQVVGRTPAAVARRIARMRRQQARRVGPPG
jgi:glycosyltransferase involved in cell wall biosynthesis